MLQVLQRASAPARASEARGGPATLLLRRRRLRLLLLLRLAALASCRAHLAARTAAPNALRL
jgi:hypothetical protein